VQPKKLKKTFSFSSLLRSSKYEVTPVAPGLQCKSRAPLVSQPIGFVHVAHVGMDGVTQPMDGVQHDTDV
jgi:hypothetical protein